MGDDSRIAALDASGVASTHFGVGDAHALLLAVRRLIGVAVSPADECEVRAAVSTLCTLAHRYGVPVERLIITLRAEWDGTANPRRFQPESDETMRARLVSECIRQFYGRSQ